MFSAQYLTRLAMLALPILLYGCLETGTKASTTSNATLPAATDIAGAGSAQVRVAFDPENQVIPFPNNLLFAAAMDSQLDGTLNVPIMDPDSQASTIAMALNDLDGFSTISAWRMSFTGPVDENSLIPGQTVRVFRLLSDHEGYPGRIRPTAVDRELVAGEDFVLRYHSVSQVLKITPTRPLGYDSIYTAVVTGGVTDTDGNPVGSSLQWGLARGTSRLDQCDEPQEPGLTLLQCTTHFAIQPIEADDRFKIDRNDMIMAWGITTQRADATFHAMADFIRDNLLEFDPSDTSISLLNFLEVASAPGEEAPRTPDGRAVIWPGTLLLPSFVQQPADLNLDGTPAQDDNILTSRWRCHSGSCNSDSSRGLSGNTIALPAEKHRQVVPALLALPDPDNGAAPRPPGGYPVVIFQHAIQQDRTNALALADVLAEQGFAVVAIDMPLHGLVLNQLDMNDETDAARSQLHALNINAAMDEAQNNTFTMDDRLPAMHERTYYLDLNSDGNPDPSGSHFLNPAQPLMQRDLLRQGALDLVVLTQALRQERYQQVCIRTVIGTGGCSQDSLQPMLNTNDIHFVSHSLGNVTAAPFLALDHKISSVSLLTPLAGIMRALESSEVIGPELTQGLADAGVFAGSEQYFQFFASVQAAIDAVEPLNYAPDISDPLSYDTGTRAARAVYLSLIAGNDSEPESPADRVMPVTAGESTPLAGSLSMARHMGVALRPQPTDLDGSELITLTPLMNENGTTKQVLQAALTFRFGGHASPLLPVTEEDGITLPRGDDAHVEMQRQLANFLSNQGQKMDDVATDLVRTPNDQ